MRAFCFFLMMSASLFAWGAEEKRENISLRSADLEMAFERTIGEDGLNRLGVTALSDAKTGMPITADGVSPLFTVEVRAAGSKKTTTLSSLSGWRTIDSDEERGDGVTRRTFRFDSPAQLGESPSVSVTVVAEASDSGGIQLSWHGETANADWSFWRGKMPLLTFRPFGKSSASIAQNADENSAQDTKTGPRAFYPAYSGIVRDDLFTDGFRYHGIYPNGWNAAMPWFAFWDAASGEGLYLAAHDPLGSLKVFDWNGRSETGTAEFSVDTPFEGMGVAGNKFAPSGKFVLRRFHGDWYDAAVLYKAWVTENAVWYPKLGPEGRADVPQWMKENSVFLMASTDERWLTPNRRVYTPLDQMDEALGEFNRAVGLPGAVHWYLWHQNPYDNDYPHFFPAKEGFAEEVVKVQDEAHFRVMPYTNGRLWDTKDKGNEDWRFSSEGKAGALKYEDGKILTETYALPTSGKEADGSACVHAAMCPGSAIWQKMVRHNVLTAMNGHNVTGVYIDQVGASSPFPCFDASHGHPVGGGDWWLSSGYRKIFAAIRKDMRREVEDYPFNPLLAERVKKTPEILADRIITTECNAEVYADLIDGFLTWHWQEPRQVPAFPVIYGGAVPMFGRCSTGKPFSVAMRVSQAVTWGEQIGWFDPSLCREAEVFPFIRDAIRCRHQLRAYFYRGRMLRSPNWEGEMPTVTADWFWSGKPNTHTDAAVQTSLWRIDDRSDSGKPESAALIFSNVSDKPIRCRVRFDRAEAGFAETPFTLRRIDADGVSEETLPPETLDGEILFPPQKTWAFELVPVK